FEVAANRPELLRPDVEHLAGNVGSAGTGDRVDEILHREQLIAVAAAAEHVDAPAVADPVEENLEHAEPLGPEKRLRADDHALQRRRADKALALDLRLAVGADALERILLGNRVHPGNAVDGGRGNVDDPP